MKYEVIVGNIGTVERTNNPIEARKAYGEYRKQSQANYGRASGEDVCLMIDGEPHMEYFAGDPKSSKMIKHKIYTWEQIQKMKVNKDELGRTAGLPERGVDCALPVQWVDSLCNNYESGYRIVDRDMLVSTTFMVYNEDHRQGLPVCVCSDIHLALNKVF